MSWSALFSSILFPTLSYMFGLNLRSHHFLMKYYFLHSLSAVPAESSNRFCTLPYYFHFTLTIFTHETPYFCSPLMDTHTQCTYTRYTVHTYAACTHTAHSERIHSVQTRTAHIQHVQGIHIQCAHTACTQHTHSVHTVHTSTPSKKHAAPKHQEHGS